MTRATEDIRAVVVGDEDDDVRPFIDRRARCAGDGVRRQESGENHPKHEEEHRGGRSGSDGHAGKYGGGSQPPSTLRRRCSTTRHQAAYI